MQTQLVHEPHKIKTIRPVSFPTLEERKRHLAKAHFNVFNLTPSQVGFDMCSLGTSAMTQEQLSGQLIGDEAYAGSLNFERLEKAVRDVLGHHYVCPTHNLLGCVKLVTATMVPPGSVLPSNARTRIDVLAPREIQVADVRDHHEEVFTGNVDLARLEELLEADNVAVVDLQAFADGQHPFSMANLRAVRALADRYGKRLLMDGSRVIENAWYIQHHTYGGMAGRTMEVFARGLSEMCIESEVQWVMQQTERFCDRLQEAGVPVERGCDGAYLKAAEFLPDHERFQQDTFSAALYEMSGTRALAHGKVGRDNLVPVQIPRLAMTTRQLDQVADAIISLHRQRDKVPPLELAREGKWRDQMRYRWVYSDLEEYEFDTSPFVVHTVERIGALSREERWRAIREAGFNTFLLRSADVSIDLLTDSGTSAMSTDQWAAFNGARATPTTSDEYGRLVEVLREATGYEHIIPTHQGRAAEQILSEIMIQPGQIVPGNMYFTTTKLHQELAGGVFADVIVDEAHDPQSNFPWKGNIDLGKLRALVEEHGADRISYVSFEHSVNMAGGQPVSMENMREVYAYCLALHIPVFFDATRMAENAYMIQQHDPHFRGTRIRDILREMLVYGDGCTVSGKKDFLINVGGLLAFRDSAEWTEKAEARLRVYEGNVTDGGLSASDLAAIAVGVDEMLDDRYIRARVRQTAALGQMLVDAGVPIVNPPGSHAIFLDAARFLPHIDQDEYPAQRLAGEIFVETGVRAMERGNVSKGRDPKTGENYRPPLELVRLTLPRRVYTRDHMRAVADGIIRLYQRRDEIQGLRFVYEPEKLRFFQGRFKPLEE